MPAQLLINPLKRVKFVDKLFFTKHLATMIKAGIPLAEAISTLVDQAKSSFFREILSGILADIENGKELAESLKKHPHIFKPFYISLIAIGEESGNLEKNLEFLAQQLAKEFAIRKKVQAALLYPALVFFATTIMGGFIALFVLPKLVDFFEAFEIELPLTTRILLFFANLMKDYGILIAVVVVALSFLTYFLLQTGKIKPKWHSWMLRFPLFGPIIAYGQLASFSRNFGTLLKSGVPVVKSLQTTAATLSNLRFRYDLEEVAENLSKGQNIGEILDKKQYQEFPPLVSKMISVGEKTGKLEDTLIYLSEFYEEEVDNIAKNLTTILEPILLISIGLIVGFVALAIISPIYELTGSIRKS